MFCVLLELWGANTESENFFDTIWQIWQKEKVSNELQEVPKEFYEDSISFISKIKDNDEQSKTTKENTIKILYNIYELRKKKVLLYIAYKKQLPQSVPKFDMNLYNQISEVYSKAKLELNSERNNFIVLQHIPKIILPSGAQIGPLEKDDTILINDEEDKKFLVNNNICKNI